MTDLARDIDRPDPERQTRGSARDGRDRDGHDRRDPLLRDVLGGVLRQARHDQQRTLAEVARAAGVSIPYLSEIERGRKEPSSEMLAAVCRALDLDLIDLMSRGYIELVAHRAHAERAEAARPLRLASRRAGAQRVGGSGLGGSGLGDVVALAA